MQKSSARYLLVFAASLVAVLLIAWLYVAAAPMAFMESGYATWAAKTTMLRDCRLGQVAFFGDSRLEAGVVPAALPVEASNFGLAAGTAVETRSAVRRALDCPTLPRQAVVALIPEHFGPLSKFYWLLSLRYGFLSPGEVWAVEKLAADLGDHQSFSKPTPDGLGGRVRDWMYAIRFPSLSFSSLVQGRIFGRAASNRARYDEVVQARGWARYGAGERVKSEQSDTFVLTKLQAAEFEALIDALRQRGVDVVLLTMPFSDAAPEKPAVFAGYAAYLADVVRRHPGVRLASAQVPVWPDRLFADGAHLAHDGALLFSERLRGCMAAGVLAPGCDLSWRPESASAGSAVLEMQKQGDR